MAKRVLTTAVHGSPMEVFLFTPAGDGPHPGLVLCQHLPGGHAGLERDRVTLAIAERYAQNGYAVAAPFLFHWWPKEADIETKRAEARDDRIAADLRAAHDLLVAQPGVDARRIGIVGHCWGGRAAWLGAATDSRYRACAIFYGGRIKQPFGEGNPAPIALAAQIRCPVIGFFGNDDTNPTPADVDDYAAALERAGVEHVFHRYDGAGHAFQSFDNAERYRHEASEDAWVKALAFFAEKLR
ncbi:MAG: dienelactone hydrolase family protein [Burkholderiales bacterium]|nr:dienelactone hydrolase family protein [Burkholderiales bacterium]